MNLAICATISFVVPRTFSILPRLQAWNRLVSLRCRTKYIKIVNIFNNRDI